MDLDQLSTNGWELSIDRGVQTATMKRLLPVLCALAITSTNAQDLAQAKAFSGSGAGASFSTADPFKEGLLALKSDRNKDAIEAFTRVLADQPDNQKAWYYRGVCHASIGDQVGALHDLDRAIELDPHDANALIRRAEVNGQFEHFDAASKDLNAVLAAHPTGPVAQHALLSLGQIGVQRNDYKAALDAYDHLISIAPDDARAWYDRGIARAHTNDHQGAYADLSHAIVLDERMETAYTARAIELIHMDRKREACPDLKKAKQLGDDSVDELRAIYCE